ncbi:MAG TPA: hypothetical protein VKU42_05060, partial [Candidatus Angelobacter sp.]|nr:hypothetical protein [Candidatus Angelobacter sp.]
DTVAGDHRYAFIHVATLQNRLCSFACWKIIPRLNLAACRVVVLASLAICRFAPKPFAQTQKIYQKVKMRNFLH